MSIYTHGDEIDPRRDGCDSCTDLRAEVDRLTAENEELNGLVGVNPRTLEHEINRLTAENERQAREIERLKTVAELASDLLTSLESDAGPTFEFPRLRYALAALNPEEKP